MSDKRIYVERRPDGDYAVRRPGSRAQAGGEGRAQNRAYVRHADPYLGGWKGRGEEALIGVNSDSI
jgi:hypothetical protein